MTNLLITATFEHVNGQAEDRASNSFAFSTTEAPLDAGELIAPAIESFYNDTQASGFSVSSFLGHGMSRAADASVIRVYDITGNEDGTPHGSPVYEQTFDIEPVQAAMAPLPEEVAIVLTLRASNWSEQPVERPDGADPGAAVDRPRQRYSGRLFFGPLINGSWSIVDNVARVGNDIRDTLLDAAEGLQEDVAGIPAFWCVWSRVDHALRAVTAAQVDNAFDTQRRRGIRDTVRTTRTF